MANKFLDWTGLQRYHEIVKAAVNKKANKTNLDNLSKKVQDNTNDISDLTTNVAAIPTTYATKTELATKANTSDVYAKSEVYTKEEISNLKYTEIGSEDQTTPSADLVVGGIFFELVKK